MMPEVQAYLDGIGVNTEVAEAYNHNNGLSVGERMIR